MLRYLLLPDQKGTACGVDWPSKRDIWCGHSRVIWGLVQPHQSHDSRLDMTRIQSTVVPVSAFYNRKRYKDTKLYKIKKL